MNSDELVKSRTHRILKPLTSYRSSDEMNGNLLATRKYLSLEPDEALLGVYENSGDNHHRDILVTTRGLRLQAPSEQFIRYSDIERVEIT